MPLFISYFNLKDDLSEDEFVNKYKALLDYIKGKIEGLGFPKLYRHHVIGAHPRTYQLHQEFEAFSAWDKLLAFVEKDAKAAQLFQEWNNLIDFKTHYDELVREIPLK
jgi:hypothetical protein